MRACGGQSVHSRRLLPDLAGNRDSLSVTGFLYGLLEGNAYMHGIRALATVICVAVGVTLGCTIGNLQNHLAEVKAFNYACKQTGGKLTHNDLICINGKTYTVFSG